MDERYRRALRNWYADPADRTKRIELSRMIEKIGGISIGQAQMLRLLAQSYLDPARNFLREPAITSLAEAYQNIDPGAVISEPPPGYPPDTFNLAEAVSRIFIRPNSPHVYPDYFPDYPQQLLYHAIMEFAGCGCGQQQQQQLRAHRRHQRDCGQIALDCINQTICWMCMRCRGCVTGQGRIHPNECVCDGFGSALVGSDGWGDIRFTVHPLPHLCGCRGSGWQTTDADSVHRCPEHPIRSHHPECDNADGDISECCAPLPHPRSPIRDFIEIDEDINHETDSPSDEPPF